MRRHNEVGAERVRLVEVTRNHEVAELLERLSLLSEASGDDRFKAIAYRRAATSVKNLSEDIDEVRKRGDLTQIQYIGEGIAKKIDEYLRTGKLEFLEKLEEKVPEGRSKLMQVSGIGPRTAYKLSKEYGVRSVAQLKAESWGGQAEGGPRGGDVEEDSRVGREDEDRASRGCCWSRRSTFRGTSWRTSRAGGSRSRWPGP